LLAVRSLEAVDTLIAEQWRCTERGRAAAVCNSSATAARVGELWRAILRV
jgi:hypothetical protein